MVIYLKFYLHSMFIELESVLCTSKTKQNLVGTIFSNSITLHSLQKFVTVVHGTFYSALSTPIEPREIVVTHVQ